MIQKSKKNPDIESRQEITNSLKALQSSRAAVRHCAAENLERIGSEKAVGTLISSLDDEDSWVRKRVIEALGEIGDKKAIPFLEKMKSDKEMVRYDYRTVGEIVRDAISKISEK